MEDGEVYKYDVDDSFIVIDSKGKKHICLEVVYPNLFGLHDNSEIFVSSNDDQISISFKNGDKFRKYDYDEHDLENIKDKILKLENVCKNNENRKFIADVTGTIDKEISYINEVELDSSYDEISAEGDLSELPNEDEILFREIEQKNYLNDKYLQIKENKDNSHELIRIFIDVCQDSRNPEDLYNIMKETKKLGIDITCLTKDVINKVSKDIELNKNNKKTIFTSIYDSFKLYTEEKRTNSSNIIDKMKYYQNINSIEKTLRKSMEENYFEIKDINELLNRNDNNRTIGL